MRSKRLPRILLGILAVTCTLLAIGQVTAYAGTCPDNAGFEGTYVNNLAPNWNMWGPTTSTQLQQGTLNHTPGGSKSQGVYYDQNKYKWGVYQQLNVTNGYYYNVSVWAAGSTSSGAALMCVDTLGGTTTQGDVAKQYNPALGVFGQRLISTTGNFRARADVITVLLFAGSYSGSTTGWVYFDDVQLSPGISSMPADTSVCPGTPATFSVVATSPGAIGYQWQVATSGSNWANVSGGSGGNTATYTTAPTTTGMNGYKYQCIVSGPAGDACGGTVISNAAVLKVVSTTPSDAKGLSDGDPIDLACCVVTAKFADAFYIQQDMTAGLRVETTPTVEIGDVVYLSGTMGTNADQERFVAPTGPVGKTSTGSIWPAGMITRSIGGGDTVAGYVLGGPGQCGVVGGEGANNISLLIRVAGKVTQVGTDYFYIDDGYGAKDSSQTDAVDNVGVRVLMALPSEIASGDMVAVTGISRILMVSGPRRSVQPLSAGDIMKQ